MTGAYLRVNRNGTWENIEVEHLTNDERGDLFINRSPEELIRWLNLVCIHLSSIENQMIRGDL